MWVIRKFGSLHPHLHPQALTEQSVAQLAIVVFSYQLMLYSFVITRSIILSTVCSKSRFSLQASPLPYIEVHTQLQVASSPLAFFKSCICKVLIVHTRI